MFQGRLMAAAFVLAVAASAPAYARHAALYQPEPVVLVSADGQPITEQRVRTAIIKGSGPLGWTVAQEQPGLIVLKYNKNGKHEAVVQAKYDAKGYHLSYVSSENLNHEVTPDGKVEIHPNYNKWVMILSRQIDAAFRSGL